MSKADRLREMQAELNELKRQNENMHKILKEYQKRDTAMALDFFKTKKQESAKI